MKDNETYLLVKDDQQRTPTKRWGVALAAVMVACAAAAGAVCGGAFVARTTTALGSTPTSAKDGFCMRPECMHALGGGPTRAGGDFAHIDAPGCRQQLSAYIASGAYAAEVDAAVNAAFEAFGLPRAPIAARGNSSSKVSGNERRLVVFDIDETSLSNIVEWEAPAPGGGRTTAAASAAAALAPIERAARARAGGVDSWDAHVTKRAAAAAAAGVAAPSPALQPSLEFYHALCGAGYPVAFVTGRSESARAATAANLESVGYGRRCGSGSGSSSSSSGSNSNSDSRAKQQPQLRGDEPCCYVELVMRPPGDKRLASVYKPAARAALAAAGPYELYASLGDQFSDLNGDHEAAYSFKLPNPFYFIL